MTDLTHEPLRPTARAGAPRQARIGLSMDGVIAAYVREIATPPGPGEPKAPASVTPVPPRPRPRVRRPRAGWA